MSTWAFKRYSSHNPCSLCLKLDQFPQQNAVMGEGPCLPAAAGVHRKTKFPPQRIPDPAAQA